MNTFVANTVEKAMGDRPIEGTSDYKEREDGSTMLALRWYGNKDVRVESVPRPALTEDKDVILKVGLQFFPSCLSQECRANTSCDRLPDPQCAEVICISTTRKSCSYKPVTFW